MNEIELKGTQQLRAGNFNIDQFYNTRVRTVSIIVAILSIVGFFANGLTEYLNGFTDRFYAPFIGSLIMIPGLILVLRGRIKTGIAIVMYCVVGVTLAKQGVAISQPNFVALMFIDTGVMSASIVLAGFLLGRVNLFIILGIAVLDIGIVSIIDGNQGMIRYFPSLIMVIIAIGILMNYFTGLLKRMVDEAKREALKQNELKSRFKSAIGLSIKSADKTSKSIISLFQQVSTSTKELINTLKTLEDNTRKEMDSAISTAENINHTIKAYNDIHQSISDEFDFTKSISEKMDNLTTDMKTISEVSTDMKQSLTKLINQINQGQISVDKNLETIQKIGDSSNDILQLNQEIQEISENTNVLSINSSIEAVNAGASGTGFKVLANEIRKLALNSAEAGKKVNDSINLILERIKFGLDSSQKTAIVFTDITNRIEDFEKKMENIFTTTKSHYEYTSSINQLVQQTVKSIQEIEKAIRESQKYSDDILKQAKQIEDFSRQNAQSIKEEVEAGEEITRGIGQVSDIIKENRQLADSMNETLEAFE
jgi:methyl-accepting chemotaxis protein